MELYSKEYFKQLANQIMFDLSDEECLDLQNDFKTLIKQMELLDCIDTTNVEPMVFPFEEATSYLREDEVSSVITQEDALVNAPKKASGQIVVPKVVK